MTPAKRRAARRARRATKGLLFFLLLAGLAYAAIEQIGAREAPVLSAHDLARERAAFNFYPPEWRE